MSEHSAPQPVPGPHPPAPAPQAATSQAAAPRAAAPRAATRFADLHERPVAEHAELFSAEHDRLQAELATIDRL